MRYTMMKKVSALRRTLGRVCLTAALSCILALSAQAQEFMNVSEVQPGMTGYAKTVVHGTTIDTFPVEILGVMKNSGPSGDLVLAKFSGPLIEETGGIAQGMSGSPIVQNGMLVGAVTHVFINDPLKGYAIFAQTMAEEAERISSPGYSAAS